MTTSTTFYCFLPVFLGSAAPVSSPSQSCLYLLSPLPLCPATCMASVSTALFRSWMSSAVGVSVSIEYTGGSGGGARNMGY